MSSAEVAAVTAVALDVVVLVVLVAWVVSAGLLHNQRHQQQEQK